MYTFTRWLDNKLFTLEEVEKLLIMDHPDDIPGSGAQYLNWKIVKVFPENKSGMFNGRQITYNYYSFSVDQIPGGSEPMDDGTYTKSGFVIPYFSSGRVRYIISRNTYAQTFLRKMLFYSGKGEVVSNAVEFSGDMFVWLISKVYSGETVFSNESDFLDDLGVDSIKGFKGNTEDLLAKVTVTGESVMNILSALSFLIESRLKAIAEMRRDKSSIRPWGSITEFMKSIRKTDLVVIIISDSYLKSVACLYEVMQLMRDDDWISYTMFLVENSAKGIYKPVGQLNYVKYWIAEKENLKNELDGMDHELVTPQAEELKKIDTIQYNINDFMKTVVDRNNPDLEQAIEEVVRRVQSVSHGSNGT